MNLPYDAMIIITICEVTLGVLTVLHSPVTAHFLCVHVHFLAGSSHICEIRWQKEIGKCKCRRNIYTINFSLNAHFSLNLRVPTFQHWRHGLASHAAHRIKPRMPVHLKPNSGCISFCTLDAICVCVFFFPTFVIETLESCIFHGLTI